jgi:hypothetical protein
MRTKALLCAAIIAAGAITAVAQSNVYSLNVVGYVNLNLATGFNLVANPLDLDGTGTNNTVSGVFGTNLPVNSVVYTYNGVSFDQFSYISQKSQPPAWTAPGKLNPGMAAWVKVPSPATATTVGNVLQGSLVNGNLPAGAGFAFVSSKAPITGALQANLQFVPHQNDVVYRYNGTSYDQFSYISQKSQPVAWTPSDPVINVGQGFWLKLATAGSTWVQNFTVQP